MRPFSINIRGRVKNFNLPKNQPLVPLFEAIVNAIHAIGERKSTDPSFEGQIIIRILRDGQFVLDGTGELPQIQSFEIIDNGIGFNEANIASFMESDSTYKAQIGGKGVGRFSWLIAFEKAEIESVYSEEDEYVKRSFDFSISNSGINDTLTDCTGYNDNQTTVRLLNYIKPYADNVPKRSITIAMRIIQHCLVYFISDDCPQIILQDIDETHNLNHIFKEKIRSEANSKTIVLNDETFELLHVKAEESTINGNKLYLCAHNRLVETKELDKYITDLDRQIFEKSGFWYVGVLRGHYLDEAVDMNRLSFNIPDGGPLDSMANMITMDQIMRAVVVEVNEFLKDYLQPIATEKIRRITDYVTHRAPQFRHLLKYTPEAIAKIKPNLSEDKLDDELHRIKREFDRTTAKENTQLLDELNKGVISSDEYIQKFGLQIEKINSANGAALAEYVAHRKVILDLMEFAIRQNDDGHFQKESFLHNIIYPMRTTSADTPYSNHNLWLLDEKLAYCSYISSDIPFNNNPKEDRTDIMILDSPVAVSDEENDGREYENIVLFELKRPMRDDYNSSNNPVNQLYEYVSQLRSNKKRDKDGRVIRVGQNTKFYLYAVCDITTTLEQILDFHDFSQTPDKLGYYKYNDKMNAYIEILSYDKIINDAKKRNRILFDKLGIYFSVILSYMKYQFTVIFRNQSGCGIRSLLMPS